MYKIRTLDDYVASASGVPVQRFGFSYRLNNVADGNQYLYPERVNVCTWPEVYPSTAGIRGYPQSSLSVSTPLSYIEGLAPGVGGVYVGCALSFSLLADLGVKGIWDMSVINDRYASSSGRDPLALLHSFSAFGAVGTAYLVDLLTSFSVGGSYSGGTLALSQQDVTEIYARPALRGSTNVHVAFAGDYGGAWLQGIESLPALEDLRFRPLDDPAYIPSVVPGYANADPFYGAPWAGVAPTVESDDIRLWRSQGRIPALCGITPRPSTSDGVLMVFDVIASADLSSSSLAVSTGLSEGRVERIAPDSNLGILFNSAVSTANPTLLQGFVKLLA